MATTVQVSTNIRPFHVDIPAEKLADLRRRLAETRWPSAELVNDSSQGVQSRMLQKLARYWEQEHDWRKVEKTLNALPQFSTTIDGLDIHFIHVKSRHKDAMPLIITHGWPGSVIEMLDVIGTTRSNPWSAPPPYAVGSVSGPRHSACSRAAAVRSRGGALWRTSAGRSLQDGGYCRARGTRREEGTRGTRCAGRPLQAGLLRRDARASADDRLRVDRHARRVGGVDARPR